MSQIPSIKIPAGLLVALLALSSATESSVTADFLAVGVPGEGRASAPARVAHRESQYDEMIRDCAEEYAVDPALVKAVIRAESSFDPSAVSRRGARGLMQLMPSTARMHGVSNLHNPRDNIRAGVRHLRSLLDHFQNDAKLAVAAYNAGKRTVTRYRGLPPYRETRTYVAKVLRFRREYLSQEKSGARA